MKKLISLLLAALMLIVAIPTLAEELPAEEIVSVEEIIPVEAVQPEAEPEVVALSEAPEPEAAPAVEPEAAPEAEEAASEADAEPEQAEAADEAEASNEAEAAEEAEFVDEIIVCEALDESVAEEAALDLDEIAAEGLSIEGDSEDGAGDEPLMFAAMEAGLTGEGIDPVFWSYLIGEFDADGDGALSQAEIDSVTTITLCEYDEATEQYVGFGVADLTGIERFRNLNYLSLENNAVTQLNVSGNANLINLQCDGNPLETLTLGTLPKLSYLSCNHANLTALNVKNNGALYKLTCSNNLLTTLDISGLSELQHVSCRGNQLTSLKAGNCEWMYTIDCRGNQLTSINVANNTRMYSLLCDHNRLTTLDLTTCPELIMEIGRSVRQEKDGVIGFSQYHFAYNSASNRSVVHLTCDAGVDVKGVDINTAGQSPENGPSGSTPPWPRPARTAGSTPPSAPSRARRSGWSSTRRTTPSPSASPRSAATPSWSAPVRAGQFHVRRAKQFCDRLWEQ